MADPFSRVVVFGDSNVDSGFFKALPNPAGSPAYNSLWASAVSHGAGAPTTNPGLMNSQVLAAHFGLTATPSNTPGGTNYASSGAKNVTVNTVQTGGFRNAVSTVTQMANYLAANAGAADPAALYYIHSGDNDVSYANGDAGTGPYPPNPSDYVTTAANDLATAIANLKTAGARTFIVAGLAYDYPANDPAKRALKLLYTNTLMSQLTALGVTFYRADINAVRKDISAYPASYGFQFIGNAEGQVGCTVPSGITTAWSLLCSSDPDAPSTLTSADSPQTRLFADDQHMGTAGQKIVGDYLYRLLEPGASTHDFNGDGKSDILWRDGGGNIAQWLMNRGTVIGNSVIGNVPTSWSIVGQRDFDGDGKYDILWRDGGGNVAVWLMNGATTVSAVTIGNIPANWSVVGTGDFNGDGKGDILWRDGGGNVAAWFMNGTTLSSVVTLGNIPANWSVVGTADFDGDGKSDILWRDGGGNVAAWFMNGATIASVVTLGNIPANWSVVGTGDFNGNGKGDILWRDGGGNVAAWFMNGAAIASVVTLGNIPANWSVTQTGDYDGDGNSDILWRDGGGNVAIWFMNGPTVASVVNVGNIPANWNVQGANAD